ncbi:hypothetical protein DRV85_16765 [Rhodosalinus halophilus]|uniref:FAS1 domain-containing protein n=1 Tax=Rhodosalinus halophilus TaxID=2259333 RepID=A0A365U4Z7_9RHOB|nr:fasciclin domain-containing protein [Rhodosalinus halophilus]RBI83252.1 hypothetical protein DRV85_16765 [Rhodosalinus halophilus]
MPTIAEIAAGDDNFDILVDALSFVDSELPDSALLGTLSDPDQNLTVFAPVDAAFGTLATALGFAGDASDEAAVTSYLATTLGAQTLSDVILYHVVGGVQTAGDISGLDSLATLNGAEIQPDLPSLVDGEPDLLDPLVVTADISADNGVVHAIDGVLLPSDLPQIESPTIGEIALGSDDFDILVGALQFVDANIAGSDLVGTLSDPAQSLTVFAPTDAAFGQLAADLGFGGDTADEGAVMTFLATTLGAETLNDVILYHVTGGQQAAADIAARDTLTMLNGDTITPDLPVLEDGEPDLIDPAVSTADVAAGNGVVHVVDGVLLPDDLPGNDAPSLAGIVAASGAGFDDDGSDFDILLAAVQTAGLTAALDDPDADLTVFAPDDAAFVGLAQDLGYSGDDEEGALGYIVDALTLLGGAGGPVPLLADILTYHVAPESLQSEQVLAADGIVTLQGGTLDVNGATLGDAEPALGDPALAALDIQASNGIAHVLDGVLLPFDLPYLGDDAVGEILIGTDIAEELATGDGDDLIDANGGADTVTAGAGNDHVDGGEGDDHIAGMNGDDSLSGGLGDDTFGGGAGDDTIDGGAGDDFIGGGADEDLVRGGDGDDVVNAGSDDDTLEGGAGSDTMGASFHDDLVSGGDGDDSIGGGSGEDTIDGGTGDDTIGAGFGDDTVEGGDGNDFLAGGGGDDSILGGAGDDRINAGDGDDTIDGGAGADVFVFRDFNASDEDVIENFEDGVDRFVMIGVENAPGSGLEGFVEALSITDTDDGALMTYEGHRILVEGVAAEDLTLEDFTFV